MPTRPPKVLYFIAGMRPTQAVLDDAAKYGPGVAFRNASLIVPEGPIEDCDAVAGAVPDNYAAALPNVADVDAVSLRMKQRDPNNQDMGAKPPRAPRKTAEEIASERLAAAVARGERPAPINERHAEPINVEDRTTQAGTPTVAPTASDGWGNPAPAEPEAPAPRGKIKRAKK